MVSVSTDEVQPSEWRMGGPLGIICKMRGHVPDAWLPTYQPHVEQQVCTRCNAIRYRTTEWKETPQSVEISRFMRRVSELGTLETLIDDLERSLGSGVWLEPGNWEQLREFHNTMAQAAEDVVMVYRRIVPRPPQ